MSRPRARKNGFERLLDTARAEPVVIEKHGRAVIVVMAIEEYERFVGTEPRINRCVERQEQGGSDAGRTTKEGRRIRRH
ncbi:MAG TPA: type II toxin-antitoxin system prevent-host-death family antitoxin [Xanthobacteraceae bacterium]|nr:type II toxin-antitoxin system prevent-host-death family antitoxin [Xanthobacteraceae bacterium]